MDMFLFDLDGNGTADVGVVDANDYLIWREKTEANGLEKTAITFPDYYDSKADEGMITFPDYYDSGEGFVFITFPDYYDGKSEETFDNLVGFYEFGKDGEAFDNLVGFYEIGEDGVAQSRGNNVFGFEDLPNNVADAIFITFPDYYDAIG